MKHLKSYKIFENKQTDEEIHELCKKYKIRNYTINEDKSIDVDGHVYLKDLGLTKLPLKFRNVSGYFRCNGNKITTLEGSPEKVNGGFDCGSNNLETLEGSPETVGGFFSCVGNKLTTLEGAPETIDSYFDCSNNKLTTLEGSPRRVNGGFFCGDNKNLMSLEGISSTIRGFFCGGTPVEYFWVKFLNEDKSLIDSFVEEWDVIHEDTVIIEVLEGWMKDNNINVDIDIEEIKSLGYKIG